MRRPKTSSNLRIRDNVSSRWGEWPGVLYHFESESFGSFGACQVAASQRQTGARMRRDVNLGTVLAVRVGKRVLIQMSVLENVITDGLSDDSMLP